MAWSSKSSSVQLQRLLSLNLVLVTVFLYLAVSVTPLAADALSKQIDHDLFLDDEGSGGCTPVGSGDRAIGDDECEPGPGSRSSFDKEPKKQDATTKVPTGWPTSATDVPEKTESPNSMFGKDAGNFFSQPGILAAIICGAIVGLLCAILLVMFIVYRMRKKDEGSYVLDDSKRVAPTYGKSKEFYA